MFRFLHLADVLLDQPLGRYPDRVQRRLRRALRRAVQHTVSRAIDERVDAVVVAGALFGAPTPSPKSVAFVREQFDRLHKAAIDCVYVDYEHPGLLAPGGTMEGVHRLSEAQPAQSVELTGTDGAVRICVAGPDEPDTPMSASGDRWVRVSIAPPANSTCRTSVHEDDHRASYLAAGGSRPYASERAGLPIHSPGSLLQFSDRGVDTSQGLVVALSDAKLFVEGALVRCFPWASSTSRLSTHLSPAPLSPVNLTQTRRLSSAEMRCSSIHDTPKIPAYAEYSAPVCGSNRASYATRPFGRDSLVQALEALDERAISELVSQYGGEV